MFRTTVSVVFTEPKFKVSGVSFKPKEVVTTANTRTSYDRLEVDGQTQIGKSRCPLWASKYFSQPPGRKISYLKIDELFRCLYNI